MTQERERIGGGAVVVLVRRALVALTAIGILATAFELATVQHWHDFEQLIPWVALLVLAMATVLVLLPGRWTTAAAWVLALLVLGASIYGVIEHTLVNYESGALDQRFDDTWETLPSTQRWWYAITKTVGPSPTLAPGILAQSAVLLFLASLIDPRRRSGEIQSRLTQHVTGAVGGGVAESD